MLEIGKIEQVDVTVKEIKDKILYITLDGYIDTYNSPAFMREMGSLVEKGYVKFIFDCKRLSYMASTGIGAMTQLLGNVRRREGNIVLMAIQPNVYDVFNLLGFSSFFMFADNGKDALSKFVKEEKSEPIFPKVVACPVCNKRLRASKPGKFRCPNCKEVITIDKAAKVRV